MYTYKENQNDAKPKNNTKPENDTISANNTPPAPAPTSNPTPENNTITANNTVTTNNTGPDNINIQEKLFITGFVNKDGTHIYWNQSTFAEQFVFENAKFDWNGLTPRKRGCWGWGPLNKHIFDTVEKACGHKPIICKMEVEKDELECTQNETDFINLHHYTMSYYQVSKKWYQYNQCVKSFQRMKKETSKCEEMLKATSGTFLQSVSSLMYVCMYTYLRYIYVYKS